MTALAKDSIDHLIAKRLQKPGPAPIETALKFITYSGISQVWFLTAAVLWILCRNDIFLLQNQWDFLNAMTAGLIAWGIGLVLKKTIKRKRPAQQIAGFKARARSPKDDSFPSTHAAAAFALFVALLQMGHPYALAVGFWAVAVAFSRIYLGVHFFSDMLGGILIGIVCGVSYANY